LEKVHYYLFSGKSSEKRRIIMSATSENLSYTRLILVRHGETAANREFRYIGTRDDELSEHGLAQVEQLAETLASLPLAAVYSSPLRRTMTTAAAIAAHHPLTVQAVIGLREGDFGVWEGMSRAEVMARSPEDARRLCDWERDTNCAPPEGESFADVQTRVVATVEALSQVHAGQTIVLVSHVGPIKVLLCHALGTPLSSLFHMFLDPATISVIDWQQSRPLMRLFNYHVHAGWQEVRWMQKR
jgi:broad specificity phosphatase PhoE